MYMYVYVYMYVCVYVCIYIYIRARVGVHMHSCRRILFICTCVSQVFLNTCMRVCGGIGSGLCCSLFMVALVNGVGGYVLAGVEIGGLSCIFLYFAGVRVVGVCMFLYARTHTQTTWVLDVSPGVGRKPGEPEESRSTKAQYTCRPYRCTQYICL